MIETVLSDPLLIASVVASLVGLTLFYLYGGFIQQNYTKIKWFRRLFLPHLRNFIEHLDEEHEDVDLSEIRKVETSVSEEEHVFDLYLREEEYQEGVMLALGKFLTMHRHFRPEILLSSIGNNPDDLYEVGNFVLTAPEKNHTDAPALGRLYDIVVMFTSKYQLHVRVFYDDRSHRFRFYAHPRIESV